MPDRLTALEATIRRGDVDVSGLVRWLSGRKHRVANPERPLGRREFESHSDRVAAGGEISVGVATGPLLRVADNRSPHQFLAATGSGATNPGLELALPIPVSPSPEETK